MVILSTNEEFLLDSVTKKGDCVNNDEEINDIFISVIQSRFHKSNSKLVYY